jgi:RNA polymerase primary sigma factor
LAAWPNSSRTIRLPVHVVERTERVRLSERELGTRLHREPRPEEVALATGLSVKQVGEVQEAARSVTSLDKPMGDEQAPFGELMAAQQPGPQEEVEQSTERKTLREALAELPEDERTVLELRYGFAADAEPRTVDEIHRFLDITRHRVSRLEQLGLSRLAAQQEVQALSRAG